MASSQAGSPPPEIGEFLRTYCLDCHQGEQPPGDLSLETLAFRLDKPEAFGRWVAVHDRVAGGEMPPADAVQPEQEERAAVVGLLRRELQQANRARQDQAGRVQYRRLNRVEYESTLRDLLALPNLEVAQRLPPDGQASGFDNVGSALDVSYVQMARYLDASSAALEQAMTLGPPPETAITRLKARSNGRLMQVLKKGKEAVPVGEAVGLLRQPNTAQAPWWWSKFAPPAHGRYRIRMRLFGFLWDRGNVLPADRNHVVTYQAVQGTSKRPLASFDVGGSAETASVHDFVAYLRQGDQLQFWLETLDDRNKGRTEMSEYTAPGVAVDWLEIEGPLYDQWPPESHRRLFGDLSVEPWTAETGRVEPPLPMVVRGVGKRAERVPAKRSKTQLYHVVPDDPRRDAERLLVRFASRAFRRPVEATELSEILDLVTARLDQSVCFQEAMRVGYQAILCAPEFLYLQESPGRLDAHALASRLSYFLWRSLPDARLRRRADSGELLRTSVLRGEVERLLDDPKAMRFVRDFCSQWLDLREINITQPDEQLYPEFDSLLRDSMVRETRRFVAEMLREDLGAAALVDSDFVMVNERLAKLYGIAGVEGVEIRRVDLPPESPRGGLLTQAAILKVTANGTTTSPVTRGAWVLDRICGQAVPPPPANVPAVEPDLRGTTTIREQLAKHRNIESCARCHRRIDPPGFALESFNCIGGWRQRYRSLGSGNPVEATFKDDRPVKYKLGLPVDPSGVAPTGESFQDVDDFRKILLEDERGLARNLARRLMVFASGGEIEFADRDVIEDVLDRTADSGYGFRSLIHAVVQSETFQSK